MPLSDREALALAINALQPFADFADQTGRMPGDLQITNGSGIARRQLTMEDCYQAKRAIELEKSR